MALPAAAPTLSHYDLKPEGRGPQVTLLCPFHDETKPSCKVNLEKRAFHCFGCGAKGNVLDFVAKMENAALPEAARKLALICGIPLAEVSQEPEAHAGSKQTRNHGTRPHRKPQDTREPHTTRKTTSPGETARVDDPDAPQAIVDPRSRPARFSWTRIAPPQAREDSPDEVEGRPADCVCNAEADAQAGPINPPLTFTLKLDTAHPYLAERGVSPEVAEAFGLGYCARGMMKGRICISIRNGSGELVAYAGRWLGDAGWPQGEDKYKLPPGFQKSHVLFNLDDVARDWKGDALVLVESFFSVFRWGRAASPTTGGSRSAVFRRFTPTFLVS